MWNIMQAAPPTYIHFDIEGEVLKDCSPNGLVVGRNPGSQLLNVCTAVGYWQPITPLGMLIWMVCGC